MGHHGKDQRVGGAQHSAWHTADRLWIRDRNYWPDAAVMASASSDPSAPGQQPKRLSRSEAQLFTGKMSILCQGLSKMRLVRHPFRAQHGQVLSNCLSKELNSLTRRLPHGNAQQRVPAPQKGPGWAPHGGCPKVSRTLWPRVW